MLKSFIITVDGPAAAGKSTLIRPLATSIGAHSFSIGSLLRYITAQSEATGQSVTAFMENAGPISTEKLADPALRTEPLAQLTIQQFSDKAVIDQSSNLIRRWAAELGQVVVDGKHAGTGIFPEAEVKLYLEAPLLTRAHRRHRELTALGYKVSEATIFQTLHNRELNERAQLGNNYEPAADAIIINTAAFRPEQVLLKAQGYIRARLSVPQA